MEKNQWNHTQVMVVFIVAPQVVHLCKCGLAFINGAHVGAHVPLLKVMA
jgi:hypothetical protein